MINLVAEVGKNFIDTEEEQSVEINLEKAKQLALKAKESGANIVKWQCHVFKDERWKRSPERFDWIKRNEKATPYIDFWQPLKEYHDELGVEFLCTPMSKMAAEKINPLVKRWKIGSADIVDFDLLKYVKETQKPIIISTGMSTKEQINKAVEFLGDSLQAIDYCISIYPCPIHKINLNKIKEFEREYFKPIGFSDHSLSVEAPTLAVKCGAVLVEKHFTLDRNAFGPDHKASLLPDEFKQMVDSIRLAEREGDSFEEEKLYWNNFRK